MRIGNNAELNGAGLDAARESGAVQNGSAGKAAAANGRGSGDQVTLSGVAQQFAAHQDRLDQLQAAVDSGTYHVPPSLIASGMIREWMAA